MRQLGVSPAERVQQAEQANQVGAHEEALALLKEASAALAAGPESEIHAQALREEGQALRGLGHVSDSASAYEEALAVARRIGSPQEEAFATNGLAVARHVEGDLDGAEALYAQAARQAALHGLIRLTGMIEQNRGVIANVKGDLKAARIRYGAARAAFEMTRDHRGIAWTSNNLGMLNADLGDVDAALVAFDKASTAAQNAGDEAMGARARINRAEALVGRNELEEARASLEEALESVRASGYVLLEAEALRLLARVEREAGDQEVALEFADRAAELARKAPDPLLLAEATREMGAAFDAMGARDEALAAWEEARAGFERLGATEDLKELETRIAERQT